MSARNASVGVLLMAVLVCSGCSTYRPTETIRTHADRQFDRGNFDDASSEYAIIIDRYPGDWRAQHRYGTCQLELGAPAEARRALEVAYTRNPDNPGVADALAESLFQLGESDQLYAFLRERAETTQSVPAYLRLADYSARMGDPDTTRVALDTAIRISDGRDVTPYVAAADFARDLGDLDLAVRRLAQAHRIDPMDEDVKRRLVELGEVPGPTLAVPEATLPAWELDR